jgi:hypothetical protein
LQTLDAPTEPASDGGEIGQAIRIAAMGRCLFHGTCPLALIQRLFASQ